MIVSDRLAKATIEIAENLYEKCGVGAVCGYANKIGADYEYCEPCENEMPTIKTTKESVCMVCGTPHKK